MANLNKVMLIGRLTRDPGEIPGGKGTKFGFADYLGSLQVFRAGRDDGAHLWIFASARSADKNDSESAKA